MPQLLKYREEATQRSTRHAQGVRLLYEPNSLWLYLRALQTLVLQLDKWSGVASSDTEQLQRIAVTYAADCTVLEQGLQQFLLLELGYNRVHVVSQHTAVDRQVGFGL